MVGKHIQRSFLTEEHKNWASTEVLKSLMSKKDFLNLFCQQFSLQTTVNREHSDIRQKMGIWLKTQQWDIAKVFQDKKDELQHHASMILPEIPGFSLEFITEEDDEFVIAGYYVTCTSARQYARDCGLPTTFWDGTMKTNIQGYAVVIWWTVDNFWCRRFLAAAVLRGEKNPYLKKALEFFVRDYGEPKLFIQDRGKALSKARKEVRFDFCHFELTFWFYRFVQRLTGHIVCGTSSRS